MSPNSRRMRPEIVRHHPTPLSNPLVFNDIDRGVV
jgi:hypothetical protein